MLETMYRIVEYSNREREREGERERGGERGCRGRGDVVPVSFVLVDSMLVSGDAL